MSLKGDVERLYNSDMLVKNIIQELDVSEQTFYKILNELKREGRVIPRKQGQKKQNAYRKNPRHYYMDRHCNSVKIVKDSRYYGCVHSIEQAERFVELMKECNWDYSKRNEVKQRVVNDV